MSNQEVINELNELRRGRGVDAHDLDRRIGPHVRSAAGVDDTDHPAAVRRKVVLCLTELCARLPADLRVAASAALALDQEAEGQFLDRRIEWLARQFDRDPRTARRRIDEAFRLLAEHIVTHQEQHRDGNGYAPEGWFIEDMTAILRVDLDPPRLTEVRRIAATADELDEIVILLSAPRGAEQNDYQVEADMIYGGEIVDKHREPGGHLRLVVRLPRPLKLGERHTYSIEFSSYPRRLMLPYYVLNPYRRCDHFVLRARFDPQNKPQSLWRLNGIPPHVVADFTATDDPISLDSVGEVLLEFHKLRQGLCYGLQWRS